MSERWPIDLENNAVSFRDNRRCSGAFSEERYLPEETAWKQCRQWFSFSLV